MNSEELKLGFFPPRAEFEQMLKAVKSAEEAGFDSVWCADHLVSANLRKEYMDAWCLLTAFAMVTEKAHLGTAVTDPCRRHPAVLAQTVATVDGISNGRVILGIGAGETMNLKPYGMPCDNRVGRLKESIEVMKGLWTQEFFNYQGRYFQLSEAHLQTSTVQKPHPPIFIAAASPMSKVVAASEADGWITLAASPEMVEQELAKIREAANKMNRRLDDLEVAYFAEFAVSEDYDTAENMVEASAKRGLAVWPKNLRKLGYPSRDELDYSTLIPDESSESQIRQFLDSIPMEAVRDTAVYGTPQDCIKGIREYVKVGVTHLILRPAGKLDEQIRLFKEKIKPSFE